MAAVCTIHIELLTETSFRDFGEVIDVRKAPPDFRGGGGSEGWRVDFQAQGQTQVLVLRTPFQGLRFKKLERHFGVSQIFVPLHGSPCAIAVAAPTDLDDREAIPRPEDTRAFLIDSTKGFLLHRGTWHSLDRFPLYPPGAVFLALSDRETSEDLTASYAGHGGWKLTQEVDFEARSGTTFELVL